MEFPFHCKPYPTATVRANPASMSEAEVSEVDAFIRGYKVLAGPQPHWVGVTKRSRDWELTWSLEDASGIASGYIMVESNAAQTEVGISVIYRGAPIYRIDIVPQERPEGNPWITRKYAPDLPSHFHGSHLHAWDDHREYVRDCGLGELPFRRPLRSNPSNLDRAFEMLISDIGLTLLPDQRGIEMPPQLGFGRGC